MSAKIPALIKTVVEASKPKLDIFLKYAKVELAPPTPSEIPAAIGGFRKLITAFGTGKWRHTPVREAWINTLVTIEVACWFFVGECIGKRHIVGYKV